MISTLGYFRSCDRCGCLRHVSELHQSGWTKRYYCIGRDEMKRCDDTHRRLGGSTWSDGSLHLFAPNVGVGPRRRKEVAA